MIDLKVLNAVLDQMEEERGIAKTKLLEAIESALATAYKKEYGKKGQIVRARFDAATGATEFFQVKIVVDETRVIPETAEEAKEAAEAGEKVDASQIDTRVHFNPEHHIMIDDARRIKKGAGLDDEIVFPLELKDDFGRIAAQTAKQVIIQKIREAEKSAVFAEFGEREGEIVTGTIQRAERGSLFVDLGRTVAILPYEEQIPGERYKQGERIRAYLYRVEETPKGVFLRLSRSHPRFLEKLFSIESPEIASGVVLIKAIAREPGSRSKVAVSSNDSHIDPIGSMVGQRGVRVGTVMSELGGEKIDIIEWSADTKQFIEDSLSPAKILSVVLDQDSNTATVTVSEDQQSLAIGKGGQNVRLAAKLTGWRIDIVPAGGKIEASKEPAESKEDEVKTEDTSEKTSSESVPQGKEAKKKVDTKTQDEENEASK
jgi:N utilization substance protein A